MKKILLGLAVLTSLNSLNAQVEIKVDGIGPDVSGTIIDINVNSSMTVPYSEHLIVTNNTGSDEQWRVTRVKQSVPAGWSDQICWPPQCYPTSGDIYVTPNTAGNPAPIIVNGTDQTTNAELAELKPQISPDQSTNGVALYMYYITDLSGNYVDSVGLRYNFTLDVQEAPTLSVSVAPNPADNYIKIKATGSNEATVKIVDVLGNVVMKETFIESSKTVDVTDFKNGIYFVRVEAPGAQTINRKVIVRH